MQTTGAVGLSGWLDAALDWLSSSHRRATLTLLVIALVALLPGFASLPPTNRDESRFAQPAKQMIESGDYFDIRLQGQARYRKPIGIYWLQAGTVRIAEAIGFPNARNRIVFYRVPSLLAALGSVLLTYWAALAFVSRRYAFLGGAALATSLLFGAEARLATIDESLLFTGVGAQGALAYAYLSRGARPTLLGGWGIPAIFWTSIAASILLKGPIVPMMVALTVAALSIADRSVAWLRVLKPVPGVAWVVVCTTPFAIMAWLRGGFFHESVELDLFRRLVMPAEGHWGPPGYFWLLFWICFWPAAALGPMATAYAWAHRREPKLRVLIAWIVPSWLMFEIVVTKLPHYVLPLYAGFAILIVLALESNARLDNWTRATSALWPLFAILLCVGVVVLALMFEGRVSATFWPLALIGILLAGFAWWRLLSETAERGLVLALIAGVVTAFAVYRVLPRIDGLAVAPRLIASAKRAPCSEPALASAGLNEPNLIFLGGTSTLITDGAGAVDFLRQGGCRVAFVERHEQRSFADRAASIGLATVRIAEVQGFDYSNWRRVSFLVLMPKEGS
jgi:4-amino-4-deoxy-L-arabinose transferase-like glycosyltransferase